MLISLFATRCEKEVFSLIEMRYWTCRTFGLVWKIKDAIGAGYVLLNLQSCLIRAGDNGAWLLNSTSLPSPKPLQAFWVVRVREYKLYRAAIDAVDAAPWWK